MEKYCDIVPHATGWVYVIDGVQSASYYHTYELAVDAARANVARKGNAGEKIFRIQALNGEMMPISGLATIPPGRISGASFSA